MSQYPTTGYTERVSQAELDRNYQETIKKMVEAYPGNEYWANMLEEFETQLHPVEQAQVMEKAIDAQLDNDTHVIGLGVDFDITEIGRNIKAKADAYKAKQAAKEADRKAKGWKSIKEMRGG